MKRILKLDDGERGGGDGPSIDNGAPIFKYHVKGLPQGEEALIADWGPHKKWMMLRIKDNVSGEWTGHYETAAAALTVLQKDYE
jgi:hypothetical protein